MYKDEFAEVMELIFSYFVLMMFAMPLYRTIYSIVNEKMTRENMKMMGLLDSAYWLSWFTHYLFIILLISFGAVLMLMSSVFPNSNPVLLYIFLATFGISTFGYIMLI